MKKSNSKKSKFKQLRITWLYSISILSFCLVSASSNKYLENSHTRYQNIPEGSTVSIKVSNGEFISFKNGTNSVFSSSDTITTSHKFKVVNAGNGMIALQSSNGKYLSSENGNDFMTCDRVSIEWWEKFLIIRLKDDYFALQGTNGRFVSYKKKSKKLSCTSGYISQNEKFLITILNSQSTLKKECKTHLEEIDLTQIPCNFIQNNKVISAAENRHHENKLYDLDGSK